eukprot:ctg_433.g271
MHVGRGVWTRAGTVRHARRLRAVCRVHVPPGDVPGATAAAQAGGCPRAVANDRDTRRECQIKRADRRQPQTPSSYSHSSSLARVLHSPRPPILPGRLAPPTTCASDSWRLECATAGPRRRWRPHQPVAADPDAPRSPSDYVSCDNRTRPGCAAPPSPAAPSTGAAWRGSCGRAARSPCVFPTDPTSPSVSVAPAHDASGAETPCGTLSRT